MPHGNTGSPWLPVLGRNRLIGTIPPVAIVAGGVVFLLDFDRYSLL
jgi:hypothetical protein